jgi:O-antigen/teichoic acid export membrane protein
LAKLIGKYFRVIKDSKYVLLINIADRLFSFVIFLLLARKFSPEDYGQIVTLFTLTTVFVTIFDLGLPIFLQRETAAYKFRATEVFSKVFTMSSLIFIIYMLVVIGFASVFYKDLPYSLIIIVSVLMYESSLINICSKALAGINDFKNQFTALWVSRLYIILFFIAGLYFFHFDLNSLMAVILIGFFLNLLLLFRFLYKNNINYSLSHFSFTEAKAVIKLSIPLGLAVLFNFMYDKIDVLLISRLKDFSEVAYYNVGYGLFKSAMLSYSFILATGFTRVSNISRNKRAVRLFFEKYFMIILLISFAASVILFALSGWLIKFIYTVKFSSSIPVLQILSAALIGNALNNLTGIILNGIGLFKAVMYITLLGLIINVVLNVFFIPVYGIIGASTITVITEYFIFFFELYYVLKILKVKKA